MGMGCTVVVVVVRMLVIVRVDEPRNMNVGTSVVIQGHASVAGTVRMRKYGYLARQVSHQEHGSFAATNHWLVNGARNITPIFSICN